MSMQRSRASRQRTRLVYIANPNNPTGTYTAASEMRRLQAGSAGLSALVIDAAYAEYVRHNDYEAGIELVSTSDNVVMTRTFSKVYGLAGIRIGWAYCPKARLQMHSIACARRSTSTSQRRTPQSRRSPITGMWKNHYSTTKRGARG